MFVSLALIVGFLLGAMILAIPPRRKKNVEEDVWKLWVQESSNGKTKKMDPAGC
jgi:hypothetical protein